MSFKSKLKKFLYASSRRGILKFFILFLPYKYKGRINTSLELWDAMFIFQNCKLENFNDIYWNLNPMPSSSDLLLFYEKSYWQKYRTSQTNLIQSRDLEHYIYITSKIDFFSTPRSILNFGSGPGG